MWRKNVRSPASGALSKYQFETATGIGMRHTFHRPLWSAFHFYLYLPPRGLPAPTSRDFISVVLGSAGTARKREGKPEKLETGRGKRGEERRESLAEASHPIFYDILFPIRGRRCRGITGVGPYATFMALNRDEVSPEWPPLPTFFFFPLFLPSADLHAILSRSLKHGTLRRK